MRLFSRYALILFCSLAFVIAPVATLAYFVSECEELTTAALSQFDNACANLGENRACFGYQSAEALLIGESSAFETFSQPGHQLDLTQVSIVHTLAPNLSQDSLGMASLNVQANLPLGLPGRDAVYVLMGDVEIENGVKPDEALILGDGPLMIHAITNADLFGEPAMGGERVGQVAAGTALAADGVSADGQWLRVYFEYEREYSTRADAWVNKSALDDVVDISGLPVIEEDSRTPMQSFYLRNGLTETDCSEQAPSLLLIQGPEDIETDITVNNVDVRISSSIAIRILPPGNIMRLIALSGIATINFGCPNPLIVPAGYLSEITLNGGLNLGLDSQANDSQAPDCADWSTPRQLTLQELLSLSGLQNVPFNILHYRLVLPSIVCPSGVGQAVCRIIFNRPRLIQRLNRLCERRRLPEFICQAIDQS
jgi:hypothetical protein